MYICISMYTEACVYVLPAHVYVRMCIIGVYICIMNMYVCVYVYVLTDYTL